MEYEKLFELEKRMDRVKELMDFSKLNIEEVLGMWAEDHGDCDKCPLYLKHICCEGKLDEFACHEIWAKYLGGCDFE